MSEKDFTSPPPPRSDGPLYQVRLFFTALQFFTRLPIPRWVGFQPHWLQHATRYFPLVGWIVAWACALVYLLAVQFWPQMVAVLLSTVAGIWLTGAFHEDGFADVCDGLGGAVSRERALEIMRDSRLGSYGVIGIVALLLAKLAALQALLPLQVLAVLGMAHPLSRWLATCLIWRMEYVREEGKVKPLAQQMGQGEFLLATLFAVLPVIGVIALGMMSWQRIAAGVVLAAVATLWLAARFRRRLGGYTGDCLGAVQQLSETAFYLGALASLPSWWNP
ncbi:adenosylcobinamide-GDP ribazoletransferase [Herbaspirillum huttiense F1]|jgi:cobalamin-5'-phosphate synthase (EC 2.7.8.26)|uniref:Adenosylcobinamide-GDP ribazoletransferase n=1 Tax=Herbaspirillum huttiense subsp. lycopersici TaxID=3074428 RepID=A0ABU2EFQ5_9BURK|nr:MULTISPECIES: adenosylcobinamide-GDP ribazoletransferase [Herbaspirillum]MBP1312870.1 adenosylcobinamide-GDP ribazoletransferase [Herbaspirillum sp. 1130]MDR6738106.1 adenosylcobinamide-GDP ribazoletransferase [Herbaspirillum sp. 1173]MDR9846979.1 adenosylcobinamide-GDP ribazoletransferase [Herbaspirillum huttiense SE1]MDT0355586.1 adenosylcobinamide-GDP ribazoletransferase [Herbaspirillum huttiense F1]